MPLVSRPFFSFYKLSGLLANTMLHLKMILGDEGIRPCGAVKEKLILLQNLHGTIYYRVLSRTPLADDADASIGYQEFDARL